MRQVFIRNNSKMEYFINFILFEFLSCFINLFIWFLVIYLKKLKLIVFNHFKTLRYFILELFIDLRLLILMVVFICEIWWFIRLYFCYIGPATGTFVTLSHYISFRSYTQKQRRIKLIHLVILWISRFNSLAK